YQGLTALTKSFVAWDTHWLFKADELFHRFKQRYKPSQSTSRAATQIKFELELIVGEGPLQRKTVTQLIWLGRPSAIGAELPSDLDRLRKRPFVRTRVEQRTVSRKGHLQSVALNDVGSLEAAFNRDSGSLVAAVEPKADLVKPWLTALNDALLARRISELGHTAILDAWRMFSDSYQQALGDWRET